MDRLRGVKRNGETLESKTQLSDCGQWKRSDCWKTGVRAEIAMMATLAGVCLRRILHRPQIIAYGDDRKQDDEKHDERDKRHTPITPCAPSNAQPEAQAGNCHQSPCEIEE